MAPLRNGGAKVQVTGHRLQVTGRNKNTRESTVSSSLVRIYLFRISLLTQ